MQPVKASPWRFIAVVTALVFGVIVAVNKTVFEEHDLVVAIYNAGGHLVTPTLVGAGFLGIVVLCSLTIFGKLSLRDIGWKWEMLIPGVAATVTLWIAMQLVEAIANFVANGQFQVSPSWAASGFATVVGVLIGQVFGTAVAEETFFRGFLLPQLRQKFTRMNAAVGIGLAIAISQLAFAFFHLPNLVLGVSGKVGTGFFDIASQLALDFGIGIVFAAVYMRTGNLFLVMGIHALQNAGTSVVATPIDPALVMLILAVVAFAATFAPAAMQRFRGGAPSRRLSAQGG